MVGQGSSDGTTASIPLEVEGGGEICFSSLLQLFPGNPGYFQLLAGLSFIIFDDLVEGL